MSNTAPAPPSNPTNPVPPITTPSNSSSVPTTSSIPVMPTPNQTKMPVAGSHYAPKFEGSYAKDYLQQILDFGAQAGLSPDDVVDYIVRYCDPVYRDQIRFRWEFDIDNPNRTWNDAAAEFITVYGFKDEPPKMSIEELNVRIQQFAAEPPFQTKDDVTAYYNSYRCIADPLRKDKTITDVQHNHYFILGIPTDLKPWFDSNTPATKQNRDSPLDIKDSRDLLMSRFDEKRSTWEPWRAPRTTSAPAVNFNTSSPTRGAADSHAQPEPQAKQTSPIPANPSVDQLSDLLGQLSLNNIRRVLNSVSGLNGGSTAHCRVCDRRGIDLDHVPGYATCPEMLELVREGVIQRNAATNRFTTLDGRNIPTPPREFRGGVAAYLRSRQTVPATASNAAAEVVAHASPASIILETPGQYYDLHAPIFALNTLDYRDALPALRSQKDTNRHDPLKRPEIPAPRVVRPAPSSGNPSPSQPPPAAPPKPTTSQQFPTPPPTRPAPAVNAQPPTNPINNRDGWKRSQSSKGKDVDMKDGTRDKSPYTPSFHFTSDAQEEVDVDALFARLSDQARVTLSFRELMGVAPKFEEKMQRFTRRRKQATAASSAEYFIDDMTVHDVDEIPVLASDTRSRYSGMQLHTDVESANDFRVLSVFISNHGSALPPIDNRLFAMVTGIFNVEINGVIFRAMVDSGSELNVTHANLPGLTSLPLDMEGRRWSLKGLGGSPERLEGCLIDAPIKIGRHEFKHHLFVSRQPEIGASFDIILGQPFLHYFAASINYSRSGQVMLLLWKDGNRDGASPPSVSISIVNPSDVRNKSEIVRAAHEATIEEVSDEDFP